MNVMTDGLIEKTEKVNKVIYYNKESMWGVFTIDNDFSMPEFMKDEINVSGNFRPIYNDCIVHFTAKPVTHEKYGLQLQVVSLDIKEDAQSKTGIIDFLTKSSISGISKKNALKIYEMFGEDSIDVTLNQTQKLKRIKGIAEGTYNKVFSSVAKYKKLESLIKFCTDLGINYNTINRLCNEFGEQALEVLKTNPYELLNNSESLSFAQIDEIALKSGIDPIDDHRLFACLKYVLKNESILKGSTGCSTDQLRRLFLNMVQTKQLDLYWYAVDKLESDGDAVLENNNLYLSTFYNAEKESADFLKYLKTSKIDISTRYSHDVIEEELNNFPFQLNEQQRNAVISCLKSKFSVITGLGGTGKSSITKAIVNILKRHNEPITLLSPTGKAAKRLEECTNCPAQTIHRFIGAKAGVKLEDLRITDPVLPKTTIIIDEASMMDVIMFNKVICRLLGDTRVILVGDTNQLPSVQAGNVLEDLINSALFNVCKLTDIMRQKEHSNIIKYCADVNEGKPLFPMEANDFIYNQYADRQELLYELVRDYKHAVQEEGLQETQVLCIYKKGETGLYNLNTYLKSVVNPQVANEYFGFSVGDKVRHIRNNYKKEVFNGETGVVYQIALASEEDVEYQEDTLIVNFGTAKSPRFVEYTKSDVHELQLAFASTVHASQGSEYNTVLVVMDNEIGSMLLVRKLLYTALSRAKKKCILYGMDNCVNDAIKNDFYRPRITKLEEFLTMELEENQWEQF